MIMLLILSVFGAKVLDCKLSAPDCNYQGAVKHLGTIRTDTYRYLWLASSAFALFSQLSILACSFRF